METMINGIYKTSHGLKVIKIFGYATKGISGLEIHGSSKINRSVKEKIIYLTRMRKLKIPMKRYVICLDTNELESTNSHELKWLEFPILLVYWQLAGLLPIRKLDDCITSGTVSVDGVINHLNYPVHFHQQLEEYFSDYEIQNVKLIGSSSNQINQFYFIDTSLLLEHIKKIQIQKNMANIRMVQQTG